MPPTNRQTDAAVLAQAQRTLDLARKLKQCQAKFCKAELAASEKLAATVRDKTMHLVRQLAAKKIDLKTYMAELDALKLVAANSAETRAMGVCMLAKCEASFKQSMLATLDTFNAICKHQPKSNACQIYKTGIKLVRGGKFDVDKHVALLNLIATFDPRPA